MFRSYTGMWLALCALVAFVARFREFRAKRATVRPIGLLVLAGLMSGCSCPIFAPLPPPTPAVERLQHQVERIEPGEATRESLGKSLDTYGPPAIVETIKDDRYWVIWWGTPMRTCTSGHTIYDRWGIPHALAIEFDSDGSVRRFQRFDPPFFHWGGRQRARELVGQSIQEWMGSPSVPLSQILP